MKPTDKRFNNRADLMHAIVKMVDERLGKKDVFVIVIGSDTRYDFVGNMKQEDQLGFLNQAIGAANRQVDHSMIFPKNASGEV